MWESVRECERVWESVRDKKGRASVKKLMNSHFSAPGIKRTFLDVTTIKTGWLSTTSQSSIHYTVASFKDIVYELFQMVACWGLMVVCKCWIRTKLVPIFRFAAKYFPHIIACSREVTSHLEKNRVRVLTQKINDPNIFAKIFTRLGGIKIL